LEAEENQKDGRAVDTSQVLVSLLNHEELNTYSWLQWAARSWNHYVCWHFFYVI
jgi:hypothetical protein